jgi:hypothetical protein
VSKFKWMEGMEDPDRHPWVIFTRYSSSILCFQKCNLKYK